MLKIVRVTKEQFDVVFNKLGSYRQRIETLPCQNIYMGGTNTVIVPEGEVKFGKLNVEGYDFALSRIESKTIKL